MKIRKVNSSIINEAINYKDNIQTIITELKLTWKEKQITIETIHLLLKDTMEIVDKFNCSGNEKKQHVNLIVRSIAIELIEDPNDEKLIIDFIDKNILGNTMDLIILASQGKLDIKTKKTQNELLSCFGIIIDIIIKVIKSKKTKHKKAVSEQPEVEVEEPEPEMEEPEPEVEEPEEKSDKQDIEKV